MRRGGASITGGRKGKGNCPPKYRAPSRQVLHSAIAFASQRYMRFSRLRNFLHDFLCWLRCWHWCLTAPKYWQVKTPAEMKAPVPELLLVPSYTILHCQGRVVTFRPRLRPFIGWRPTAQIGVVNAYGLREWHHVHPDFCKPCEVKK